MNFIRGHDRGGGPQKGVSQGRGQSGQGACRAREARGPGGRARQQLQGAIERFESLERDCKAQESELAKARQSKQDARAEAQSALQEIQAAKKITAGVTALEICL